ncbi:hypothetical protein CPB85DRAFT_1328493 [Mucidula mucida]|nr:hypothetical protein CPB85DRAFT_1328493 [Mucidula mucida]
MSVLKRSATYLLPSSSEVTPTPPPAPPSRAASHGMIRPVVVEHPRMRAARYEDAGTRSSPLQRRLTPRPGAIENNHSANSRDAPQPDADFPVGSLDLYSPEIPRTIMGNSELVFVAYNRDGDGIVVNPLHCPFLRKGWELDVENHPLPKSSPSYLNILMWVIVLLMFTVMVVDFAVNGRYNPLSVF